MSDCPFNPASETIADFIYRFGSMTLDISDREAFPCVDYASYDYAIVYLPLSEAEPVSMKTYPYYSIPKLYTTLDLDAAEASGILPVFETPALSNQGDGVLIGIVDTGIDYTNPLFLNSDGSTRIAGIWDQTLPSDTESLPPGIADVYPLSGASYGTAFTREELNEALSSDNPLSLVPTKDTDGHGTFLAGLAAGNMLPEENFTGAAPKAELLIVKLKPAKQYLRDYYLIRPEAPAFQENDIMMGIKYLRVAANLMKKPLVILLGLGSNYGSHTGSSPLSQVLENYSGFFGITSVIAAGNETGFSHHYFGSIPEGQEWEDVELRIDPEEAKRGLTVELWSPATDSFSVGFLSPSGERINRIPIIANNETSIPFLLESTVITVNYQLIEAGSGNQLIFIRFEKPAAGIWTIRVYNTYYLTGQFHMWLPVHGFLSDETVFLQPDPDNTITSPGNSRLPVTVSAYNADNNSIYIHSSRGFTLNKHIKPDLAAPGVDINGPAIVRQPGRMVPMTFRSGTSAAAAITAGAAANLLSWGIVSGNSPTMSATSVKSYLIRGAKRNPALTYPNREFGYGTLDLLQSFLRLRE